MKIIVTFIILFLLQASLYSQTESVKGTLSTTKLVDVDVMKISPLKPPKISIVFRAATPSGEPAWNLKKEEVIVRENDDTCNVLKIEPISKNKPISLGLAIDHSGSMAMDITNIFDWIKLVKGQTDSIDTPLDNAKRAAKVFVNSFNPEKDYISLVAFGSKVDSKVPLTQDTAKVNKKIDKIKISGSTAFYDALIAGMKQIRRAKGIKVLVALTDGNENSSKAKWDDVIDYSSKNGIPIYVVGLGSVDQDTLKRLASTTKGQFFYTKKSSSLVEVYKIISKQIQSFYALEYETPNLKTLKKDREIKISFDLKSIYLANDPTDPDVIAYLKKKKFEEKLKRYGKNTIYILIGTGAIVLLYRRKKRKRRKLRERLINTNK